MTEALAAECLSLPIFPGVSETQLGVVIEAVGDYSGVAEAPANDAPFRLIDDVVFGENVVVHGFTNLYGCRIGNDTRIGPFVEVQRGAVIGSSCQSESHTFICDGVVIEDDVFVGHGVLFINDKFPRATTATADFQTDADWRFKRRLWNAAPHLARAR